MVTPSRSKKAPAPTAAEAPAVVATLQQEGVAVQLLSGDRLGAVQRVAAQAGIAQVQGECSPQGKLEALRALQAGGHQVAMVGDGLNDGPVLAQTPVAILPCDTVLTLSGRVRIAEHQLYPPTLAAFCFRKPPQLCDAGRAGRPWLAAAQRLAGEHRQPSLAPTQRSGRPVAAHSGHSIDSGIDEVDEFHTVPCSHHADEEDVAHAW